MFARLTVNKRKTAGLSVIFLAAFLLSVIVQLPASWVLSQPSIKSAIEQKINPNSSLHILASRGTIWQGEVDLAIQAYQTQITRPGNLDSIKSDLTLNSANNVISLGSLSWNWQLSSLFLNNIRMKLNWILNQSNLSGLVSTHLFATDDARTIEFTKVMGVTDLNHIIQKIPKSEMSQFPVLQNLAGLVNVNELAGEYQLKQNWFKSFTANLQVDSLKVMNNVFPRMTIKASLEKEKIMARINGQQKSWSLTGAASLNQRLAYQVDFNLNSQSENALPDWAFLMRKKSATNYVSKLQGRFF